jgi:hypothetical protein
MELKPSLVSTFLLQVLNASKGNPIYNEVFHVRRECRDYRVFSVPVVDTIAGIRQRFIVHSGALE